MAFTKIVSPGIDTTGSYTVQELNTVGVATAGTVQVGSATTIHTTGIDLGSGNITSHNINSTGIISATSFVGPVTGNVTSATVATNAQGLTGSPSITVDDITATSGTFSGNVSIGGTLTYEDVTNIDSVGIITARSDVNIENTAPTLNLIDTDGSTTASLLGNSGNIFYDTSSINRDHIFRGSTTEVVRITGDGKVGIGTIVPETNLTIAKNATNQTVASIPTVRLTNLDTTAVATDIVGSYEFFSKDVHSLNKVTGFMRNIPSDAGVNYDLTFGTIKTSDANAVERLRITSDGNVGIGTDDPVTNLTVYGNTSAALFQNSNTGTTAGDGFYVGNYGGLTASVWQYENDNITFGTNNIERLKITNDGKFHTGNPSGLATDDFNITSTGTGGTLSLNRAQSGNASDGDLLGAVSFQSYPSGSGFASAESAISAYAETGQSGSAAPSDLRFYTKPSSSGPGASPEERVRIRSNGDLILGPYDAPGSYTTAANNVPYSIKVAPYGWQHHSELAAISMGNHSGSTGNDDGEIVFKTTSNAHSSTDGLVERLRIDSNGDSIFYGNPSIDARYVYYKNTYNTNSWSTSTWYTVVPHGLTSNSTYLVSLVWDYGGSGGSPYYLATQQLYSTVSGTNGTGSENEMTPMVCTHTGGTGTRIKCRVIAQAGGQPAMQVNLNWTQSTNNYLRVKVWKMTFRNRDA